MIIESRLGLRIDVDTFRGTRDGIPALLRLLGRHGATATFFFSVGPDNMGRHLLRLRHPSFLAKMWRSRAVRLYGWDILFRGLLKRGPLIGRKLGSIIRATAAEGHEVGLHAWDHFGWQNCALTNRAASFIERDLQLGVEAFQEAAGRLPDCSAAPAWLGTPGALRCKARYPFRFNSDCRGESVFRPSAEDSTLRLQPQIPTTLPVYDEVIGRDGLTDGNYNRFLVAHLRAGRLNVLTIHAEVEGIACRELFDRFLVQSREIGFGVSPLGALLEQAGSLPDGRMELRAIPGREGLVAVQLPGVPSPAGSGFSLGAPGRGRPADHAD